MTKNLRVFVSAIILLALAALFSGTFSQAVNAEQEVAASEVVKSAGQIERYELEKPHTQILFFAEHLGFSTSNGRFSDFEGSFMLDRANPKNSSVEVKIDAASVYMGHEKWEAHLKNEDFFDVEAYPEIDFISSAVEITGEDSADVHGVLSIRGVEKPVTLKVKHNKSGVHPFNGKYVAGFSAQTSIKRSDFGMTYGLPLLADEVKIVIEVEGIRQDAADAESAEE